MLLTVSGDYFTKEITLRVWNILVIVENFINSSLTKEPQQGNSGGPPGHIWRSIQVRELVLVADLLEQVSRCISVTVVLAAWVAFHIIFRAASPSHAG